MKKAILSFSFVAILSLATTVIASETRVCTGSGEHCMDVDLGNGTTAKFVKAKGSAAIIIKD